MGEVGTTRKNDIFEKIAELDRKIIKHEGVDEKISDIYLRLTKEGGQDTVEVKKKGIFRKIQHFFQNLTKRGKNKRAEHTVRKVDVIEKWFQIGVENVTKRLSSELPLSRKASDQLFEDAALLHKFATDCEKLPKDMAKLSLVGGNGEGAILDALSEKVRKFEKETLGLPENVQPFSDAFARKKGHLEKVDLFFKKIIPMLDSYSSSGASPLDKAALLMRAPLLSGRDKASDEEIKVIGDLLTGGIEEVVASLSSGQITQQVWKVIAQLGEIREQYALVFQDGGETGKVLEKVLSDVEDRISEPFSKKIKEFEKEEDRLEKELLSSAFDRLGSLSEKIGLFDLVIKPVLYSRADSEVSPLDRVEWLIRVAVLPQREGALTEEIGVIGRLLNDVIDGMTPSLSSGPITDQVLKDLDHLVRFRGQCKEFFRDGGETGKALERVLSDVEDRIIRLFSTKIGELEKEVGFEEGMKYFSDAFSQLESFSEKVELFLMGMQPALGAYRDPGASGVSRVAYLTRALILTCNVCGEVPSEVIEVIRSLLSTMVIDTVIALSSGKITQEVRNDLALLQKFRQEREAVETIPWLLWASAEAQICTALSTKIREFEQLAELDEDMRYLSTSFDRAKGFSEKMNLFVEAIAPVLGMYADPEASLLNKKLSLMRACILTCPTYVFVPAKEAGGQYRGGPFSDEYMSCFVPLNKIAPGLYLGNYRAYLSTDPEFIKQHPLFERDDFLRDTQLGEGLRQEALRQFTAQIGTGATDLAIKSVLSVTQFEPAEGVAADDWSRFSPKDFVDGGAGERKVIPIDDDEFGWKNVYPYLEEAFSFIDSAIGQGNPTLIHCVKGANRSATLLTAYLMKRLNLPYKDVINYLTSRRPLVAIKPTVESGLKAYEQGLPPPLEE